VNSRTVERAEDIRQRAVRCRRVRRGRFTATAFSLRDHCARQKICTLLARLATGVRRDAVAILLVICSVAILTRVPRASFLQQKQMRCVIFLVTVHFQHISLLGQHTCLINARTRSMFSLLGVISRLGVIISQGLCSSGSFYTVKIRLFFLQFLSYRLVMINKGYINDMPTIVILLICLLQIFLSPFP
jgi:hypothetical protein